MKTKIIILLFAMVSSCALSCSENKNNKQTEDSNNVKVRVGGPCEGCEAVYESPVEFDKLNYIDTLPDYNETGPKIIISGVVYNKDGVTPAAGVVIYVYHTDQNGYYSKKGGETGMHGYIRGWMRTNEKGEYMSYTLKPAPYPSGGAPGHIHAIIKEPGINEYYIDDYVFEGEKYVDENYRKRVHHMGGSGIIKLEKNGDLLIGKRDLILGKNIQDYP